nr:MAG TPA: hypothetical protein [Caudoviricetes sp.]
MNKKREISDGRHRFPDSVWHGNCIAGYIRKKRI